MDKLTAAQQIRLHCIDQAIKSFQYGSSAEQIIKKAAEFEDFVIFSTVPKEEEED